MSSGLAEPARRLPPLRPSWTLRDSPDPATVNALAASLHLPEALCRLLSVRGHADPGAAKAFLRPLMDGLHDPAELADGARAVERIVDAIESRETILVHGDYDVDGISGAALLTQWIRSLGGRVRAFVPHRLRDGYDLSGSGVARAAEVGATLLVTVDCGIVAHEWIRRATDSGIDVVVTDHHRPGPALPPALAVVNPNRPDCTYPNKDLCGAAVAFKVGQLVATAMGQDPDAAWKHLDLVAMATIADQVPLSHENRVLVRHGLEALGRTERPGLRALMNAASLRKAPDSTTVAYVLAPRINAAGRVGETDDALQLLLTPDLEEAETLASELERNNRNRRELDRRTLDEALERVAEDFDPSTDHGIVVAGDGWHPGVIGIVASRIVERVFRPVVMISLDGERGRGSARSIPSFHLYEALAACADHLDRFGGHGQAAGMDLHRDRVPAFREAFRAAARERLETRDLRPALDADLEIRLEEIPGDFYRYLRYLGPFGQSNPDPVFVTRGVYFDRPPKVTDRGHLKFRMVQDRVSLDVIGFGLGDHVPVEGLGTGPVDVAYTLSDNTYGGHTTIQARALDVRPAA